MALSDDTRRTLACLTCCLILSHSVQDTSLGQDTADSGSSDIVDPELVMRGRFDELIQFVQSEDLRERSVGTAWLSQLQWPDSQAEQAAKCLSELLERPYEFNRQFAAEAIQSFVRLNPAHGAQTIPALVKAIPNARYNELVALIGALAEIGPAAAAALPSLQQVRRDHENSIIRIHTAVAQFRIDVEDREPLDLLVRYLANEDAGDRLRAADGLRRVGPPAQPATTALRERLNDGDSCVRVAAAAALWTIGGDAEAALPVLIRAMSEPDRALSTKFIYPSFQGDSHRAYAAQVLGEMGPKAVSAVRALTATVKDTTVDINEIPAYEAIVGLRAVDALGKIGPGAREALPTLYEAKRVKNSMYAAFPHVVVKAIARIENQTE